MPLLAMSGTRDIRGYINPFAPRRTEAGQRAAMPTGAELYVENHHGNVIDRLIRSVRRGTIVAVQHLDCLAPGDFNAQKRRRLLAERIEAIQERDGSILELATGYRSNKGRLPKMMLAAHEVIAHSGRRSAANGAGSKGAPRWYPRSGPVYEGMRLIYQSRRFTNINQRRTQIKKDFGYSLPGKKAPSGVWLFQQFGPADGKQAADER
jgi:hypothetical protein